MKIDREVAKYKRNVSLKIKKACTLLRYYFNCISLFYQLVSYLHNYEPIYTKRACSIITYVHS